MKRNIIYVLALMPILAFFSCEEKLEPYSNSQDRLNFPIRLGQTLPDTERYTFVYDRAGVLTQDTLWITVRTMGFVPNYDRVIPFVQLESDKPTAAKPGIHYVPLDDPEMLSKHYKVKAGEVSATVPIIMKRDPSLKTQTVSLRIGIGKNEYFDKGYVNMDSKLLEFADKPIRPNAWTFYTLYYYAGQYGEVKHQFMIDALEPMGLTANEDFFLMVISDPMKVDMAYTDYWYGFFTKALDAENEKRRLLELPPLREAPKEGETEGRLVKFNNKTQLPDD